MAADELTALRDKQHAEARDMREKRERQRVEERKMRDRHREERRELMEAGRKSAEVDEAKPAARKAGKVKGKK